ncbi:MAG: MraY family glycosyltransferase [Atribacterota bacterium]
MKEVLLFSFFAFIIAWAVTPLVILTSQRLNWFDWPGDQRKVHERPVPRLGGVSLFISFLVSFFLLHFFLHLSFSWFLVLGVLIFFLIGFLDDLFSLSPWIKLLGQVLGAVLLIQGGVLIRFFTLPWDRMFYLGFWGYPLTLMWIVGISNALNLIDGLDGLSGGVGAIASFTLGMIAWQEGRMEPAILSFLLSGGILGFLLYNFPPARIFLGDGGALFLGAMLASTSVQGATKSAAAFTLAVPILILGIPIFDTFFAIVRRKKNGLSILHPDRGHLHHRLLEKGYSQREVVVIFYGISALCGGTAILINFFLANSTYSLLFFFFFVVLFLGWGKNLRVTELPERKSSVEKS